MNQQYVAFAQVFRAAERALLGALFASCLAAATVVAQTRPQQHPPGWSLEGEDVSQFSVAFDSTILRSGHRSLRIRPSAGTPNSFAVLTQWIDVTRLRDRPVLLNLWLRLANVSGRGVFTYVAFVNASGARVGYTGTGNHPRLGSSAAWVRDTLSVVVPNTAISMLVGIVFDKSGTLWVDDISLGERAAKSVDIVKAPSFTSGLPSDLQDGGFESGVAVRNSSTIIPDPPRDATTRDLDAMVALAKLTGYVRFFHPTDSVAATNWTLFLTNGMRAVGGMTNADNTAAQLSQLFAGVAPSVQVFTTARGRPAAPRISKPTEPALAIAYWLHRGVGLPTRTTQQAMYSSTRVIQPVATRSAIPAGVRHPDNPIMVNLGGGVSALIPTSLWVGVSGVSAKRGLQPVVTDPGQFSVASRAVRLAAIADVWMTMQHFYPYFEHDRVAWSNQLRVSFARAATDRTVNDFEVTLKRLMTALRDGHGYVERGEPDSLSYGIVLRIVEHKVVVTRVIDSTRTDVRRGDVVLAVNGVAIAQYLSQRLAETPGATTQWREYRIMQELMYAAHPGRLQLELRSGRSISEPVRTTTLFTTAIGRNNGPLTDLRPRPRIPGLEAGEVDLGSGIFYVDLDRIKSTTMLRNVLSRVINASDVIFDVRGFPMSDTRQLLARLIDRPVRSAHSLVPITMQPDGAQVTYEDSAWVIQPLPPKLVAHAYFLVDGRDVSSAESFLSVVEKNNLGEIVGEPTAGTNGNINPFRIPGGFTIRWTGMLVRKQDGSPHHGVGILPTMVVHPTLRGVLEGRDEQLERTLALIRERRR